jgi:WD40 repeat protein
MRLIAGPVFDACEHLISARWLAGGKFLVAVPTAGVPVVWDGASHSRELADHGLGNGCLAVHPSEDVFVTGGADGKIRMYSGPDAPAAEILLGRGWIDRARWSPDGSKLAVGLGKHLVVLNRTGEVIWKSPAHKSTVCDLAWNPVQSDQLAVACDGGAHLWTIGGEEPFARFDWGGASLIITWSLDGRWVITGDQTPSVHLYDVPRDFPLHIQGYESKVKALAISSNSRCLATGGSPLVTVWNCTGKTGPENTTPKQLEGHDDFCLALEYRSGSDLLVSGGADGRVLVFEAEQSVRPRAAYLLDGEVVTVAWHPKEPRIVAGTSTGKMQIFDVVI